MNIAQLVSESKSKGFDVVQGANSDYLRSIAIEEELNPKSTWLLQESKHNFFIADLITGNWISIVTKEASELFVTYSHYRLKVIGNIVHDPEESFYDAFLFWSDILIHESEFLWYNGLSEDSVQ